MVRPRLFSDAEILQVARRCFLEHGPAVSTTVIASEVGLSQAALFKRFGTKQNLMLLALPLMALMGLACMVTWLNDRRRARRLAARSQNAARAVVSVIMLMTYSYTESNIT